jgi:predicted ABC-type exoprotein transport system permease subunit
MKPAALRRRLWLPLVLLVGAGIIVIAAFFRWIGLGEIALFVAVLVLVLAVESVRYVVRQFLKGYRRE